MAIENSIANTLPNYALLDQYGLIVIGEFYLSIQHNLMSIGSIYKGHKSSFSSNGFIAV